MDSLKKNSEKSKTFRQFQIEKIFALFSGSKDENI